MSTYRNQADRLVKSLELSRQPIAVAFHDVVPEGIPSYEGTVPAGCSFWQEAGSRAFATSAKDHALCSIGIHTHNLADAPGCHENDLRASLQAMIGLDYIREDEVAAIPVLHRKANHALYGPLAEFPVDPEVVLIFAHARQGLVLAEAVERVDRGAPAAMGRPACAVIPRVLNHGRAAMSLGCCGARAYLDALPDSTALWALPGSKLDHYCEQVEVLARANRTFSVYHEHRRTDIEAGARPTILESLGRLSSCRTVRFGETRISRSEVPPAGEDA